MTTRRDFLKAMSALPFLGQEDGFRLDYVLASALYGTMPLEVILPEVARSGASALDVWCLKHGNQREQVEAMGVDAFAALLKRHDVALGALTSYPKGPFGQADELRVLKRLGGRVLVTGSGGPKGLGGTALKDAVGGFVEKLKPHADLAGELGVRLAIENHGSTLLSSPESLRRFADANRSGAVGVAFAPHHLHEHAGEMPRLIEDLGPNLAFFYAQERGLGFTEALGREKEMLQLPGFGGGLEYRPLLAALRKIRYAGFVEIFMHPTPRGVPILPTAAEITAAVNRSRAYLDARH
jgi:sugar phosphate isomerase/epimerase